jgi:hypothetical protein
MWSIKWKAFYLSSLKTKLILAPLCMPIEFSPQRTDIEWTLCKLPQQFYSCTKKLTKHRMSCMQINQRPNKTPVESTDNSNGIRNWSLVRAATDAFLKDLSSNRKKHLHELFRLMGIQCSRNKSMYTRPAATPRAISSLVLHVRGDFTWPASLWTTF